MLYTYLARTGYLRNIAYKWSHMFNNLASALFGFVYISLWGAVAPPSSATDPYTRTAMISMMVLAQVLAWVCVFLPPGLQIQNAVRSGSIALEMTRPVPFFPMVMVREAGNVAYQALYRSLPLAVLFAATVGFPLPASAVQLLLAIPSLVMSSYVGLTLAYSVGISSLWTVEIRWAYWMYLAASSLLSGGWIPPDMLPGWLGKVAPYLPFASQLGYTLRIYLGMVGAEALLIQGFWVAVMTLWCVWITNRALHRVIVQGG